MGEKDLDTVTMATTHPYIISQNGELSPERLPFTNKLHEDSVFQILNGTIATVKEESRPYKAHGEDDELTNLTWLQDNNLLRNIHIVSKESEDLLSDSPTSDFIDDSDTFSDEKTNNTVHLLQNLPQTPYNPRVHINSKPPYSFSCLIFMAIEESSNKALPVKDIYSWILSHFPYFQNAPTGWKNSVRHNLSLNKCFRKVDKDKGQNVGKGSLWSIDPEFRPNLLQALSKTPYNGTVVISQSNQLSPQSSPSIESDEQLHNLNQANGLCPELFPYLSKCLAASSMKDTEADAAATMLSLHNGTRTTKNSTEAIENCSHKTKCRISSPNNQNRISSSTPVVTNSPSDDHTYSASLSQPASSSDGEKSCSDVADSSIDEPFEFGDDNSCESVGHKRTNVQKERMKNQLPSKGKVRLRGTKRFKFPDEAEEERKKVAEGARALLNLAKIATSRRYPLRSIEEKVVSKS